jgi:WhiB family transcriptional regulator, redox-sensing transcriptional regulator
MARIRAGWRSADPRSVAQIEPWSAPGGRNRGRGEGGQFMSETKPTAKTTNIAAAQGVARSADAEEPSGWVSKALCRTTNPDELFVRGAAQRKAAVICRHCPVMQECGAEALDNKVEFGVWGGMTERQRRALLNEHPEVVSWSSFLDKRRNRTVS